VLLSEGVSVKAVSQWLGHASPTVTLNVYSHVLPVDDDRARLVLARAWGGSDVYSSCNATPTGTAYLRI
jgi:integrase